MNYKVTIFGEDPKLSLTAAHVNPSLHSSILVHFRGFGDLGQSYYLLAVAAS